MESDKGAEVEEQQAVARAFSYVDEIAKGPTRYRLVLIVGLDESKLSGILQTIAVQRGYPILNVGLRLSEALAPLSTGRRALKASDVLRDLVREVAGSSAILAIDNIDILFDPALQLNPLDLLAGISRAATLVVAWPGQCTWNDDLSLASLSHADPSHDEYRNYVHVSTPAVVDLEQTEAR